MTGLARWLALPAIAGLYLGILREQIGLALLSLSVIVWLLAGMAAGSRWRVWFELPATEVRTQRQWTHRAHWYLVGWPHRCRRGTSDVVPYRHRLDRADSRCRA